MALKYKITKSVYEALSDEIKAEYKEKDGEFVLDVDGLEDTGALRRAKDREAQARREAEASLKESQERIKKLEAEGPKDKDVEALQKAWDKEKADITSGFEKQIEKLTGFSSKTLVDNAANTIAGKISKVPSLMARAIKDRLSVDFSGDSPQLQILDNEGKPSELTLDQLQEEFVANKEYSDIIIGTKASGGAGRSNGGAVSAKENSGTPVDLLKLDAKDFAARLKDKVEATED